MKKPLQVSLVLGVFSFIFFYVSFFLADSRDAQPWVFQTRDILFKVRHVSSSVPAEAKGLVIVAIDDESCDRLGMRWPWSRRVFAKMIAELSKRGAGVIGLNLSLTGLEDGQEDTSRELAAAMSAHGRVVIGATFDKENRLLKPHPILSEAAAYGYMEKIVDEDYNIRRSYLLRPYQIAGLAGGASYAENSFPLKLAAAALGGAARFDGKRLDVGAKTLSLNSDGSYLVNYLVKESDLAVIPAWKVAQGRIADADVRGKTVLIGLTSALFSEKQATPLGLMPGVLIHANEFVAITSGRLLSFAPDSVVFGLSWLVSLGLLTLLLLRRFWIAIFAFIAAVFAFFFVSEFFFAKDIVMEPFTLLAGPAFAALTGLFSNLLSLMLENKGLETKVIRDKMTDLYTYDYLRTRLEDEWRRCQKLKLPVAIAMTDLDRFKKINDTLGHETGNQMILRAAGVIRESVRGYDVVSRYGGDEFVILLWHTSLLEAKAYRDRLRALYHAMAAKLDDPMLKASSISIGVSAYDPRETENNPKSPQELVETADKDLFADKESRRKPGEEASR